MLEYSKALDTYKVITPGMTCVSKKHYRAETDNQQASPFEIGWLVAFLEGEGSIGLYWNSIREQIYPVTTFVNTEECLTNEVSRILSSVGVGNFKYEHRMNNRKAHWKNRHDVHVSGIKRNYTMLDKILPFWITPTIKRQKAEIVYSFCRSRLANPIAEIGRYTAHEFEMLDQFRLLSGKSSEAMRSPAPNHRKRMI